MTTSFALAAHGRFYASFVNQPFGFIVFAVTLGGLLLTATMAVTARSCVALLTPYAVVTFFMTMLVLALVSWAYKWAVM